MDERVEVSPWTEIPYIPLEQSDPTRGGQFFSDAREINIGDGGNNVFRVDRQGMWLGAALYEDAPFKVSMLGAVVAESLEIIGGTITGATIQTSALAATGIKLDTDSLRGYNTSGDNTLTISTTTGFISVRGYSGGSITRVVTIAPGNAQPAIGIEDSSSTDPGFQWQGPTSGGNSASRQGVPAFYHYNHDCDHGDGFTSRNTDADWDGKHFHVRPNTAKNIPAFMLDASNWSGVQHQSQITTEGFIDFPAFFHSSDFEELPAALASSVIANAHWLGGGTSGTQIIRAEGADGFPNDITYVRLSTTATGSRSSSMIFRRAVQLATPSRWDALLRVATSITTVEMRWGWYYDANNYAYFFFDTDQHATKLYFAYNSGSGETLVDLNVAIPTSGFFNRYSISIYAGKMYVYYEDVLKATITATVPNYGYSYFYVENKASAVERTIDVDYARHWAGRTRNF